MTDEENCKKAKWNLEKLIETEERYGKSEGKD